MTVLDRAFIKAYRKASAGHGAISPPHVPLAPKPVVAAAPRTEPARAPLQMRSEAPAAAVPAPHLPTALLVARAAASGPSSAPAGPSNTSAKSATQTLRVHPPAAKATTTVSAPPASKPAAVSTPPARGPRPAFEVPRLPWPALCQAILRASPAEWNAVADRLVAAAQTGDKLLVVTSRYRGEGRTTIALCLARLLTQRGVKLALVDGDYPRAELGRRLRLLPQSGWENLLAGEPLEEGLIESLEDRLTLLPWKAPLEQGGDLRGKACFAQALTELRRAFDLVLVEAGPVEETPAGGFELLSSAAKFDAALVVCDVRSTPIAELDTVAARLQTAGIGRWSMIENYVAG